MTIFFIYSFLFTMVFISSNVVPKMIKMVAPICCIQLYNSFVRYITKRGVSEGGFVKALKKEEANFEVDKVENVGISLLDIPDLPLDLILEQLKPSELCRMAGACGHLRAKCKSDHLWEKHMKKKWARVMGNAALRDWHAYMAGYNSSLCGKSVGFFQAIFTLWPFSLLINLNLDQKSESESCDLPPNSVMAYYIALESGQFWFPAQVYNRENGHDGFILSCYDAKLSYSLKTDTFQARYSPHSQRTVEENITWSRLRVAPIDTPPFVLHVSDCLDDLKAGDHFEIQWRRNKEYPYGWWYGVVGHLNSCSTNAIHCSCHENVMVMLEFNQYAPESRWRRKEINRKNHGEEGNEVDGFYGGIRKIYRQEEILTWKSLWPNKVLS